MKLDIIPAHKDMCKELANIKKQVWQTTYKGIYPNEKVNDFNIDEQTKKFLDILTSSSIKLYVVKYNNRIIGYTAIGKSPRRQNADFYELVLLYVLKEFQGKGIGKSLFNFAKEKLRELNHNYFMIYCNKYNINAHNFYLKMGCKIIEIDPDNEDKSKPQTKFIYQF